METEKCNISLINVTTLLEMVFITVLLAFLIRILHNNPVNYQRQPALPFLLLSVAIAPTLLRRKSVSELGLHFEGFGMSLRVLGKTCIVMLPILICSILLLNHYEIALPLCPVIAERNLVSWSIYQFLCVAFAEEVFFRGYLQSSMGYYLSSTLRKNPAISAQISVVISAAIFSLFHGLTSGNAVSLFTFFPGMIFGWLFIRTKSLVAPILFHGLSNISYGLLVLLLP